MTKYNIFFKRSAVKDLDPIPKKDLRRHGLPAVKNLPVRIATASVRVIIELFIPFKIRISPFGLLKSSFAEIFIAN
jgi:hypothetical protein